MDDKATSVIVSDPQAPPARGHETSASPLGIASARPAPPARRKSRGGMVLMLLLLLAAGGGGAYYYLEQGHKKASGAEGAAAEGGRSEGGKSEGAASTGMRVEVVHPKQGGLDRKLSNVCSVHAFEHAQLFAKVNGFLKTQTVDIGDKVKKGDLLAVIDVPEILKAVEQAAAALEQSKAAVKVADAKIRSAQALKKASEAAVRQTQAEVATKVALRMYRDKQLERIKGLVLRNAVEKKLQDEAQDEYDAAIADEKAAEAAVLKAEADVISREAMVEQANADLIEARANVDVAQANLEKAQVLADYTKIISPYDGVVTLRSFHIGDFVRSASDGTNLPMLAVARTDLMRVVIPVPDREVPFTNRGDKATIVVDALPNHPFPGVVSRFSESESAADRNMRTEVDLPNKDDLLREGMYGQATLLLQAASPKSVTVPSTSLLSRASSGEGQIYIVRDGKAHIVNVRIGIDNGDESEIVDGLNASEQVIFRYNGAISEGTPVTAEAAKVVQAAKTGH